MIKFKKITPLYSKLVTTMDMYEEPQYVDGIIDSTKSVGAVKELQQVVSVGGSVPAAIKEGKYVCVNPDRFAVKKHKDGSLKDGIITDNPVLTYNFPVIYLNNTPHLLLDVMDIDFVVDDFAEEPDTETDVIVN